MAQNDGKKRDAEIASFMFELIDNQGIKMVDPAGFEPATKGLWDLRSNHWAKDPRVK